MATQTTEIAWPVLDSQATYTFIDQYVASGDQSGDINTDFKKALIAMLELTGSGYSLDDLWARYQLSTAVTADGDVQGGPSRTPPEHAGQHPRHFLPPGRLRNPDNATPFPVPSTGVTFTQASDYDPASAITEIADWDVPWSEFISPAGGAWANEGSDMYWVDQQLDLVLRLSASTAYDASTLSWSNVDAKKLSDGAGVLSVCAGVSVDGKYVFWFDSFGDKAYTMDLDTAFDLTDTNASNINVSPSLDINGGMSLPTVGMFTTDGDYFVTGGTDGGSTEFNFYTVSTPFDASTISTSPDSKFNPSGLTAGATAFTINGAGDQVMWLDSNRILYSAQGTAYDMSDWATDSGNANCAAALGACAGIIAVNPDDASLTFVETSGSRRVRTIPLDTPL